MPSSSKKQHNFMAAIANSPAFAKKVGIPQSVGSDFERADKGRKFAKGGETMATKDKMQDKAMIKRAFKQHDMQEHKGGKGTELKLKHGGMTKRKFDMGGGVGGDGDYQTPVEGPKRGVPVSMPMPMPTPAPKVMGGSAHKMGPGIPNSGSRPQPPKGTGGDSGIKRAPVDPSKMGKAPSSTAPHMPGMGPRLPPPMSRPMPVRTARPAAPTTRPAPGTETRSVGNPGAVPRGTQEVANKVAANRPFKSGGSVGSASTRADGIAQKGKTQAMQVKMASGGYTVPPNGINKMASGGMANSASRRADGIAQKGKTKAMQIKMMNGGKC